MLAVLPCPSTVHGLLPMENPTRPATPIVTIESKNLRMTPLPEPSTVSLYLRRCTERERAWKPYMPASKPVSMDSSREQMFRCRIRLPRNKFLKQSCLLSRHIYSVGNSRLDSVRQECRERSRIDLNGGEREKFWVEILCDVRRSFGTYVRCARASRHGQLRYQQADYSKGCGDRL